MQSKTLTKQLDEVIAKVERSIRERTEKEAEKKKQKQLEGTEEVAEGKLEDINELYTVISK